MKEPLPSPRIFRFASFELDPQSGQLRKEGVSVKLQKQPADLLAILVEQRGQVVTREELRERLWPGKAFGDFDIGLNNAVRRLREALDDSAQHPRYIETLPQHGYRFIASVTEASPGRIKTVAVLPVANRALKPRRLRSAIAVGAAAVLALAVGLWYSLSRRPAPQTAEPKIVPLTSYPDAEMGVSFSPDGNQVAFAWKREGREDFDLYVKVVGVERPLQLTNTPEWDVGPAWSPDGQEIAFLRSGRQGGSGIYTVSPLGGAERLVAELDLIGAAFWGNALNLGTQQLSWSPDGKWLAYEGISMVSVATGEKRRLTIPPDGFRDYQPAFSPDGQFLAFMRGSSNNLDPKDLYVLSTSRGELRRMATAAATTFGLCWTPDGREIVYSSARNWAVADSAALWGIKISGGPPRRLPGTENAAFPAIARQGRRLAFSRRLIDMNIWRTEATGTGGFQQSAARVIASTRIDAAPAFSPDGKRVAFLSDRSGNFQVWICDRDGSNVTQLTSVQPGAGSPAWSPDGRYVAFDSKAGGNFDIYVIASRGGAPRPLTRESGVDAAPNWSRDGRWVYFTSDRTGRFEIWKIPAQGGTAVQVTRNGGHRAMESLDGKFVYYNRSQNIFDAWRIPADGGEETHVSDFRRSRWTLAENGLYFFEEEQGGKAGGRWFLKFFDFATGRRRPVAALAGTPVRGQIPTLSPDGRTFLYTQWDLAEADLVLIENFR